VTIIKFYATVVCDQFRLIIRSVKFEPSIGYGEEGRLTLGDCPFRQVFFGTEIHNVNCNTVVQESKLFNLPRLDFFKLFYLQRSQADNFGINVVKVPCEVGGH
jgi:hypothetical protein